MNIETKFDIGQEVWHVWTRFERMTETCSICGGAGKCRVVGGDDRITCPKCDGRGETQDGAQFARTLVRDTPVTIRSVRVRVEGCPGSEKREEQYMMVVTGVGSVLLYDVNDLFATQEEAQEAARERTLDSLDVAPSYSEVDG